MSILNIYLNILDSMRCANVDRGCSTTVPGDMLLSSKSNPLMVD